MTTVSNSNASCFRVGLSWVELRWVLTTSVPEKNRLNFDNKLQGENEMFSLLIYFYIHLSIYLFTLFIHLVISRMNRFLYRISEE